ncbi:MAG: hypothetical protein PUJ35_02630 [Ruminococcus bromii]|nr:hypothetical protein [Ruminococcus bromii]
MAKRTYVKPELLYESFVLAQHIAACFFKLNQSDVNACETAGNENYMGPVEPNGFVKSNQECLYEIEAYCYTPGANDWTTHTS